MSHLVVLTPAAAGTAPPGYDLRIGPLHLQCPLEQVSEQVGTGLEQVGAALTPGERRPRPLKLKLPVRGYHRELDTRAVGFRQRRQVRQLLDNERWMAQGVPWSWDIDPDLDGWLLIGSGEISETNLGITFADFELALDDVWMVARPGTHRMARRLDLADRRTGLVPRDTRGVIYSTSYAGNALPSEPLTLPGDVLSLTGARNRAPASSTAGPALPDGRRLWRTVAAEPGEVVSYMPDTVLVGDRTAPFLLDDLGAVKVWDIGGDDVDPGSYTGESDRAPDVYRGWERVLGDPLTAATPLAMDNGWARVIWLGPQPSQGLALESWDASAGCMRRHGRVLHATNTLEHTVVEITPDRGVLEFRAGDKALRVILQRGWTGPRLESYADSGGTARVEYAPTTGAPSLSENLTTGVDGISHGGGYADRWAKSTTTDARTTTLTVLDTPGVAYTRSRAVVGQIAHTGGDSEALLAGRAACDHQAIPTLVARRQT